MRISNQTIFKCLIVNFILSTHDITNKNIVPLKISRYKEILNGFWTPRYNKVVKLKLSRCNKFLIAII